MEPGHRSQGGCLASPCGVRVALWVDGLASWHWEIGDPLHVLPRGAADFASDQCRAGAIRNHRVAPPPPSVSRPAWVMRSEGGPDPRPAWAPAPGLSWEWETLPWGRDRLCFRSPQGAPVLATPTQAQHAAARTVAGAFQGGPPVHPRWSRSSQGRQQGRDRPSRGGQRWPVRSPRQGQCFSGTAFSPRAQPCKPQINRQPRALERRPGSCVAEPQDLPGPASPQDSPFPILPNPGSHLGQAHCEASAGHRQPKTTRPRPLPSCPASPSVASPSTLVPPGHLEASTRSRL